MCCRVGSGMENYWSGEMMPTPVLDDLSVISGIHTVGGESQLL